MHKPDDGSRAQYGAEKAGLSKPPAHRSGSARNADGGVEQVDKSHYFDARTTLISNRGSRRFTLDRHPQALRPSPLHLILPWALAATTRMSQVEVRYAGSVASWY